MKLLIDGHPEERQARLDPAAAIPAKVTPEMKPEIQQTVQ